MTQSNKMIIQFGLIFLTILIESNYWWFSGSGKTNVLLNLIKNQCPYIDRIYLYIKDPFESECQLLINGRVKVGIKTLKNPKEFVDYSQTVVDVYEI